MRIALKPNSRINLSVGSGTQEYVIDNTVGSGATCIVYSAHYEDAAGHKRFVRIKECYPHDTQITRSGASLCWADTSVQSMMLERFRNAYQKLSEMQNTQGLRNSTAHVFDLCEANSTLYSVMDMNEGKTFDHDSTCSLQDILKTALALTRVIEKYHANGYLHLDIKPGNFLVLPETRELVVLFDVDTVTPLEDIRTGNISSIPYSKGWAAPEQMQGKLQKLCHATDLYAIGAILFERVFARPVGSEDMGIFARWDYDESLCANENPKIRRLLTDIFHKTLAANIRNRYQSAAELSAALEDAVRVVDKGTPYLTAVAPTSYINFVGRQEELRRIFQTFDSGKRCIFLQGFGGIGKTELAKKYAETYSDNYDHVVFLRHSEKQRSIKSLLLENIQIVNYEDDYNDSEPVRRNKRLEKIKHLLTPHVLIILDNYDVETPDSEFMELLDWNANWLVTTRTDFSYLDGQTTQISVAQMAFSDLLEIFCKESKQLVTEVQKSALEKLFDHFDNYTMVVTLLAKQVYVAGLTVEELCDNEDIYDYEERVVSTKDASVTQDTLIGHLQRVFNMASLSEGQQEALRTVWMMRDANEITKQFYKKYSGMSLNPLNSLISLGWLQYNGTVIATHPVIEQMIERILMPTCQNCPNLYRTFLQKLSALRNAVDTDDSGAYSGETENLFRLYVFLNDTDEQMGENLLTLSLCLLDLYERYEVPEFMWFNGWENQEYFCPKIFRALSCATSANEEENVFITDETLYGSRLTFYVANLVCDFCRMQLEGIDYSDNSDITIDSISAIYRVTLFAIIKHSYHKNDWSSIQRQVERISKIAGSGDQSFEESIFMSCCSICETGEYRAWNEDDDIGGISPHKNENHWKLYVVLFLALGLCLNNYTKDEKGTTRYQEHTRALRRMHAEILRAGFGYNHFYDFYDLPRETEKEFFAKGATWDAEKHFCHAEGISCFDEKDPQAYLMEVCQTLLTTKKPFYLYKLLLNADFRISDWVKEWLIEWNIGKRIAEDTRLSNAQKRYIAEFAIENWQQVPPDIFPDLQKHCIYEILQGTTVPQRTKIGIYNAIARKYITAVVKYGYGWEHCKTDELETFKEGFSLMQDVFPLQDHSPNEVCGIADAIFVRQNKLQFDYSTTKFAQSYSRYVAKISTEKIIEWDRHYAYMNIAHIVGENAGARVIIEQLVPRLLAYFVGNDPAEYIYTSREVHRISKKYNIADGVCVIECYHCRQPVEINSDTCPHCHAELF